MSLDVYELLVAQHGTDDTGEVSGAHDDVGRAAMLEVLHGLAELSSGTPHFRGEDEVRIRQAEVVGRARGMSDEALEQVTGRKYAPKKGLIPTCAVAKVLDAKKHAADEAAAQAKKLADAAVVEAMRPRTFGEIGVDALRVPKARLRTDSIPLSMLYEETDHRVIGVRTTLGYEIPPTFAEDSITSLTGDAIVPAGMRPASEPTAESIGLVKTLRARHGKDLYLGAIPRQMFVDAGHDRGRALAATHAGVLLSTSAATLWRHTWLAELLVRGLLIRPDVATKILGEAVDRESERRAPRMLSIPSTHHAREVALDGTEFAKPSEGRRDILNPSAPPGRLSSGTWLGDLTASAMDAGHVSAGALLEPTTFTPTTKPSVKKGK